LTALTLVFSRRLIKGKVVTSIEARRKILAGLSELF
jgi:hypothetical protein